MKVKVIKEFLGIPISSVGTVCKQDGGDLPENYVLTRAMWIKFDCKDMPVGIPEPFNLFVETMK